LTFQQTEAEKFHPEVTFDVIVFNEMIYYVNHEETMIKYAKFLNPGGIFIISVWFSKKIDYLRKSIFHDAHKLFPGSSLGAIQISGKTLNLGMIRDVSFHIEAFKPKVKQQ